MSQGTYGMSADGLVTGEAVPARPPARAAARAGCSPSPSTPIVADRAARRGVCGRSLARRHSVDSAYVVALALAGPSSLSLVGYPVAVGDAHPRPQPRQARAGAAGRPRRRRRRTVPPGARSAAWSGSSRSGCSFGVPAVLCSLGQPTGQAARRPPRRHGRGPRAGPTVGRAHLHPARPRSAAAGLSRLGRPVPGPRRARSRHAAVPRPLAWAHPRGTRASSATSCLRTSGPSGAVAAAGALPRTSSPPCSASVGAARSFGWVRPVPRRPTYQPADATRPAPQRCAGTAPRLPTRAASTCRAERSVLEGRDRQGDRGGQVDRHVRDDARPRRAGAGSRQSQGERDRQQHQEPRRLEVEDGEAHRR